MPRLAAAWCSHRDIVQLVDGRTDACDDIGFEVVCGVADNRAGHREWESARDLVGYELLDSAFVHGYQAVQNEPGFSLFSSWLGGSQRCACVSCCL